MLNDQGKIDEITKVSRDIQQEEQLRQYASRKPTDQFVCFDLMLQFIERCIEDKKDPTPYRETAIYIACGCSVDGKSNSPSASGGRSMPSMDRYNPFYF